MYRKNEVFACKNRANWLTGQSGRVGRKGYFPEPTVKP